MDNLLPISSFTPVNQIVAFKPDLTLTVESTSPNTNPSGDLTRDIASESEYLLETVQVAGKAEFKPQSYSTRFPKIAKRDVGYLYDATQATLLAITMGKMEIGRSKAWLVKMPPPPSWLKNPKPFAICAIGTNLLVMDAVILEIQDGEFFISFTGINLGTIPAIASPSNVLKSLTGSLNGSTMTAQVLESLTLYVGVEMEFFAVYAYNPVGTPVFGLTSPPSGISINSSTGVISGTPQSAIAATTYTVYPIAFAHSQRRLLLRL